MERWTDVDQHGNLSFPRSRSVLVEVIQSSLVRGGLRLTNVDELEVNYPNKPQAVRLEALPPPEEDTFQKIMEKQRLEAIHKPRMIGGVMMVGDGDKDEQSSSGNATSSRDQLETAPVCVADLVIPVLSLDDDVQPDVPSSIPLVRRELVKGLTNVLPLSEKDDVRIQSFVFGRKGLYSTMSIQFLCVARDQSSVPNLEATLERWAIVDEDGQPRFARSRAVLIEVVEAALQRAGLKLADDEQLELNCALAKPMQIQGLPAPEAGLNRSTVRVGASGVGSPGAGGQMGLSSTLSTHEAVVDSPNVSLQSSMGQSTMWPGTSIGTRDDHASPQDVSLTLLPSRPPDPLPLPVAFAEDGSPTGWRLKEEEHQDALYWGDLQNGKKHGKGRYALTDGTVYVGEFQNGLAEGEGTIQWPNKHVYTGQWKNGQASGHGLLRRPGEWQYVGQFFEDMRHGTGRCEWASRAWYDGSWSFDQKQGLGEDGDDAEGATHGQVFAFQDGVRQDLLVEAPMAPLSSKFKADARWQGTVRVKLGKVVSKKKQGEETEADPQKVATGVSPETVTDIQQLPLSQALPPKLPPPPPQALGEIGSVVSSPSPIQPTFVSILTPAQLTFSGLSLPSAPDGQRRPLSALASREPPAVLHDAELEWSIPRWGLSIGRPDRWLVGHWGALIVTRVHPGGALESWSNAEAPSRRPRPNYLIWSVNGVKHDAWGMASILRDEAVEGVTILFRKPAAERYKDSISVKDTAEEPEMPPPPPPWSTRTVTQAAEG